MIGIVTTYINDVYGSKRAFIRGLKYSLLQSLGYLRKLRDIDFDRVRNLVIVCSGNVCRSPFGEMYARHLGLQAESFGLDCRGGDPPDARVAELAKELGISHCSHATRNIGDYRPSSDDLVIVMEPDHLDKLPPEVRETAQVTLAPLWANDARIYLHDPFSGSPVYFRNCAATLVEALDTIAERLHAKSNNG
jgi:protein-tyrosine phosphatase